MSNVSSWFLSLALMIPIGYSVFTGSLTMPVEYAYLSLFLAIVGGTDLLANLLTQLEEKVKQ